MRKLIIAMIPMILTNMVAAQDTTFKIEKAVICDDPKKIVKELVNSDFEEMPIWTGADQTTKYVLFVNQSTGTWTFLQYTPSIGCILGVGDTFKTLDVKRKN